MRLSSVLALVLVVAGCVGSPAPAASPSPPPATRDGIGAYLAQVAKADEFSGVVLIAKDFVPFAGIALGESDRSRGTPISLTTPFNVASIAKLFTAAAIGQLVDQGKVGPDDQLSKHLPAYPKPAGDQVTIAMLLAHTAGTGDYLADPGYAPVKDHFEKLDDLLSAIDVTVRPGKVPGRTFEYSNTGYLLLGSIIEKASGRDFYDYVADEIFLRAGVAGGYLRNTEDNQRLRGYALGYRKDGSTNWSDLPIRGTPAGGAYATAADLLSFHKALATGVLAKRETLERLVLQPPPSGKPSPGLTSGVFVGGDVGASAVFAMTPAGYTVVVLANEDDTAEPIAGEILKLIESAR